jgi:hypothetical protein
MDILMAEFAKRPGWLRPGFWLCIALGIMVVAVLTGLILHFGENVLPYPDNQSFVQVGPSLPKGQTTSLKTEVARLFRFLKRVLGGQQISLVATRPVRLLTAADGYARYTKARVYVSEEVQDIDLPAFKISALTGPGIARGFETMLRSNGVLVLTRRPNSVWFVSDGKTPIQPAIAPPELRAKAESGNSQAQFELATWYFQHKPSTSANRTEACKWALIADNSGCSNAASLVKELELSVKPQEMTNGKSAAGTFLRTRKPAASPP